MANILLRLCAVLAACCAASPACAETVLLKNVGPSGAVILVEDGTIIYAGPVDGLPHHPPAESVDAAGAFATPGLIDMHVHVWGEAELAAYVASGVTTVRNLSGMPFHLRLARAIEAGEIVGPHLFTSGPILNSPGPNQQINHQIVVTEEDGRAAVRWQHEAGFSRIKTYSNLTADAYRGALAEAREHGMRITGHTPEGERLEGIPRERPFLIPFTDILDDGFETIEHVESIVFHGLSDRLDKTAADLLVSRIAEAGVPVTATLVAQRNLVRMAETDGAFAQRPGREWLNPVSQATETENIAFWSAQDPAREANKAEFYSWMTARLHAAGVPIVAGSDAGIFVNVPGVSLLDELDLLVAAGLSAGEAVDSATIAAADALGKGGRLGCMEADCAADLVFTDCDPRADVACLRSPRAVMRAGRWYDAAGLAALRERASQHDREQIVQDLLAGMQAQGTPLDPALLGL